MTSFSGRLPISTSFNCFSGDLSYSFIWVIILFFFFFKFWLAFCDCSFCSGGCGSVVPISSVCPLMAEDKRPCVSFLMGGTGCGETGSCSGGQGCAQ